jgi:hypothetical protein
LNESFHLLGKKPEKMGETRTRRSKSLVKIQQKTLLGSGVRLDDD